MPVPSPPVLPPPVQWGGTIGPWLMTTASVVTILAGVRLEPAKEVPVVLPPISLPFIGPPRTTDTPNALAANPFMTIGVM